MWLDPELGSIGGPSGLTMDIPGYNNLKKQRELAFLSYIKVKIDFNYLVGD